MYHVAKTPPSLGHFALSWFHYVHYLFEKLGIYQYSLLYSRKRKRALNLMVICMSLVKR